MDLNTDQLLLEQEAVAYGQARYWRDVDAGVDSTPVGMRYVRSLVEPLAQAITDWRTNAWTGRSALGAEVVPILEDTDSRELAYLTLSTALRCASGEMHTSLARAAVLLGGLVEEHAAWTRTAAREDMTGYLHVVSRSLAKATSERHRRAVARHVLTGKAGVAAWTERTRAAVGTHLLERAIACTGHFQKVTSGRGRRTRVELRLHPDTATHLESAHDRAALLRPNYGPMVVPPLDWDEDQQGGYLTMALPLIKSAQTVRDSGLSAIPPAVMEAVNALQRTPWQVNRPLLGIMQQAWGSQEQVAGLPRQDPDPLPAKPVDIADNEQARTDWKRRASRVHADNAQLVSKRLATMSLLGTAQRMTKYERVYFPYHLDWRGRAYAVSTHLSPQSDDPAKALLRFAEGKPLGEAGRYWLAVHLANLWGYDKVSLDERARWAAQNTGAIMEAALSPLDGTRWWAGADKPWCFLAACLEWSGCMMQGVGYVSHLPVHVDGSCNGLQHFAAMLRDPDSAAAVNLTDAPEPQDVYQRVADAVSVAMGKLAHPDAPVGAPLPHGIDEVWPEGVPRSVVKRPVMTLPYGVTAYGMRAQVEEELRSEQLFPANRQEVATLLADNIHSGVGSVVAAAHTAMAWLQQCADAFNAAGLPIRWTTPLGLSVTQDYRVQGGERLAVYIGGQRVRVQLSYSTATPNSRKQKAGISPNFVHSMDAAHLMDTVLHCKDNDITSIAAVHDSYGTLAADVDRLGVILRRSFIALYRGNLLADLADEFRSQGVNVPDPPPMGTFDITEVERAAYFFA